MDYGILIAAISIVGTMGLMLASVTAPPPSVPVAAASVTGPPPSVPLEAESDREHYQKAA